MKLWLMVVGCLLVGSFAYAEQKIVFGLESMRYTGVTEEECQDECTKKYKVVSIDALTNNGWKIVNVSPKEYSDSAGKYSCTCVGMNLPRNCGQSEKLLQTSTEDCYGIKKKVVHPRVQS